MREGGREGRGRQLPWVRAGGRIWTEGEWCVRVRPGRNSMEKTARERVGVCWRERLVGIKAPSLIRTPISPVSFFGGVCVRVCLCIFWKGREECVCLWTDNSSQDASAAGGDLGAGGTLLLGERGFFSLWQDSHPQSHKGQEGRVRRRDVGMERRGATGVTCKLYRTLFYFEFSSSLLILTILIICSADVRTQIARLVKKVYRCVCKCSMCWIVYLCSCFKVVLNQTERSIRISEPGWDHWWEISIQAMAESSIVPLTK